MFTSHLRQLLMLAMSTAAVLGVCLALTVGAGREAHASPRGLQKSRLPVNDDMHFPTSPLVGGTVDPGCIGDLDGNGVVDVVDLLALLADWGPCDGCAADLDMNGVVDVVDLLALLGAWGNCP
jgi:hypothetical protein